MEKNKINIETNDRKYIYIGFFIVFAIFGVLIGWAIFAKIDTVVIAPGKVVVKSYKKPVEYKEWGSVSKVFVREGDYVRKGDPLIELDKLEQDTNLKINKIEYYTLLAKRDRLISEKENLAKVKFSEELLSLDDKTLKEKLIRTQKELFKERKKKLNKELQIILEKENQLKEKINNLQKLKDLKLSLLKEYKAQIAKEKNLVKEGFSSDDKLNSLKEKLQQTKIDLQEISMNIAQSKLQIEELAKQKSLKVQEYQTDIVTKLEDTLTKLDQIKPKMKLSETKVKKSIIKAPESGQIIGLKVRSKGQVVKPGDIIMYIVPKKDELFVQVKVMPQDRDKVKEGQLVDLQFPAFLNIGANIVEGKVTYVASDTLFDEITKTEYYETHIQITENGFRQLKKYGFNLVPGMPATAFIKVEKVTPLEYIMQPVIIMIKSSFTSN